MPFDINMSLMMGDFVDPMFQFPDAMFWREMRVGGADDQSSLFP